MRGAPGRSSLRTGPLRPHGMAPRRTMAQRRQQRAAARPSASGDATETPLPEDATVEEEVASEEWTALCATVTWGAERLLRRSPGRPPQWALWEVVNELKSSLEPPLIAKLQDGIVRGSLSVEDIWEYEARHEAACAAADGKKPHSAAVKEVQSKQQQAKATKSQGSVLPAATAEALTAIAEEAYLFEGVDTPFPQDGHAGAAPLLISDRDTDAGTEAPSLPKRRHNQKKTRRKLARAAALQASGASSSSDWPPSAAVLTSQELSQDHRSGDQCSGDATPHACEPLPMGHPGWADIEPDLHELELRHRVAHPLAEEEGEEGMVEPEDSEWVRLTAAVSEKAEVFQSQDGKMPLQVALLKALWAIEHGFRPDHVAKYAGMIAEACNAQSGYVHESDWWLSDIGDFDLDVAP